MSLDMNVSTHPYGYGLNVRNVNEALPLALQMLDRGGINTESRGLRVVELPGPTFTVYRQPWENVLFCPVRDANPFFHFFEAMWILAGSDTVDMPAFFLNRITDYSDNGKTFHGAYGWRLRNWPDALDTRTEHHGTTFDQLETVVELLRQKPDTRQAVLSIWDPVRDLGAATKDMPCNDMIMLKRRNGRLDMTVCNRSNDAVWGAYGANAVQFSVLQCWLAARIGCAPGYYVQMSDSLHVYEDNPLWQKYLSGEYRPSAHVANPYDLWLPESLPPLFLDADDAKAAEADARGLDQLARVNSLSSAAMLPSPHWKSTLGRDVMRPMLCAFVNYRNRQWGEALLAAGNIQRADWRVACEQWITRRERAKHV